MPALPGETPTLSDWADHLTTIFPEARIQKYMEMRGADGGPWRRLCALPALWVGLTYDQTALDAAWDLCRDWTIEEHAHLRAAVPRTGLATAFRGATVQQLALQVLEIAEAGLAGRRIDDWDARDERKYLHALWEIAKSGISPATEKRRRFEGEWQGSVDPVFAAYAY